MDDLVRWLSEQLDADERIARRAGDSFRQIGDTGVIVATEGDRAEECASANWAGIAEHIVEHDPARVLRETAAKRAILAWHRQPTQTEFSDGTYRTMGCRCYDGWPCTTLRALAAPYVDRPGFREDWAL